VSEAIREKLRQALSKIDRPGTFCVSGSAPSVLPGLEVHGLGPVGLPLTVSQAKDLLKHCDQAPYGKGEKTLVDKKVRRVWRMEPDRFSLTNPEWDRFLAATVAKVQEALGLEKQKLESHLYDLLLYERGSFFLPHKDGEKLERMVASLIVALPSTYEGGELVVRHEGQEQTIDFRGPDNNPFHTHFAAFYADCEHEVRPLRKGYRLCLVYNLTLAKSKKTIVAPREGEHIARIGQLLREWSEDKSAEKLVITLDHQYTEAGLSWDALKGVDRAKAKILREAAGAADCKAYLALLTFHESGSAEYEGGGRRRYYDDDEDDDAEDYEMGEIFDSSLTATQCGNGDDKTLPIKELDVEEDELLDPEALRAIEPEEEFEGFTGNAGMTIDHWYRHAAILVWPIRRHFEILCNGDGKNAVHELVRMVARWQEAAPDDALKRECIELGRAILAAWREVQFSDRFSKETKAPDLLKALGTLDDPALIGGFFALLLKDVTLEPGKSVTTLCETHGWAAFAKELRAVMDATSNESIERNVRLLEQICSAKPRKTEGWSALCETLAQALVAAVERADAKHSPNDWRMRDVDRGEVLAGLVRSLLRSGQTDLLARVVAHALATPKLYPLRPVHMDALTSLIPWLKTNVKTPCDALATWIKTCREKLEALTAKEPEPPADFRREAKVNCKCADCAELKRFLEDPREPSHRFSVRQDRRNHLTQNIRDGKCDLDLRTDTKGSPQTLVCTKNTASFQERLKTYHQDQKRVETVRSIEESLPGERGGKTGRTLQAKPGKRSRR
jgi:hypothetical protein